MNQPQKSFGIFQFKFYLFHKAIAKSRKIELVAFFLLHFEDKGIVVLKIVFTFVTQSEFKFSTLGKNLEQKLVLRFET